MSNPVKRRNINALDLASSRKKKRVASPSAGSFPIPPLHRTDACEYEPYPDFLPTGTCPYLSFPVSDNTEVSTPQGSPPLPLQPLSIPKISRAISAPAMVIARKVYESIIVTIRQGGSYDSCFTTYKQESPTGIALVLAVTYSQLEEFNKYFTDRDGNASKNIKKFDHVFTKISSSSVCFNFECCGGCSHGTAFSFGVNKESGFELLRHLKKEKIMTNFADFSLGALITDWDESVMDRCPFEKIGTHTGCTTMFIDSDMTKCSSKQLSNFAELNITGRATVELMAGTVVYKVNEVDDVSYTCKVYSLLDLKSKFADNTTKIGELEGTAGHTMLDYDGWRVLVSGCHFVELMKNNTTLEKFSEVSMRVLGRERTDELIFRMESVPFNERAPLLSRAVTELVTSSQPSG